ncbi:S-adenosyl-L-methionine-dependent methyltransferase [Rhizoclosmatium globosum]|uniref:NOL1/NOP2/Sun domain family member 4 n=1 Tax=Rhizoclosmatium globosum TaxID=329046 RepID=A0A1Y2C232_9FUNG|nr:S-adenosyl-L-methionine-dependent methyltransferase [Rhizoclosmatium globosum]|eukprot:ORY41079.1 S-adenosyl-L-methionine-dependent methyltransferase [Rhizoclosmatium globosum]
MRALNPVEGLLQIVDLQPGLRCVTLDESNRDPRPFPPPKMDMGGVKTHYLMDLASVVATEGLDLQPGDTVLDMCAAPGGKSFCMLQRLGPRGRLIANEMSNDRRTRLRKVLKEYIPTQILTTCIETTGFDGTKKDSFPRNTYPKILCDAPCSSERHVLHDDAELGQWSAGRTKASAKRQVQLLGNALRAALDEGGRVVYATCSISKHENDLVVQKVIKKSPFKVNVRTHDRAWMVGEPTEVGWIVLPDTPGRWGPLYFAVLEKDGYKEDGKEDDGLDDMDDMDD